MINNFGDIVNKNGISINKYQNFAVAAAEFHFRNYRLTIISIHFINFLNVLFMGKSTSRVPIPSKPKELLSLSERIFAKHSELGEASPLNVLTTHKWENNGGKITLAKTKHEDAEEYNRRSEQAYRERDLLLSDIKESVKASRDVLMGVYRENPKMMGEFGFTVDDSPRAKK